MQDDEAGAVGDEVGERLALGREAEIARGVGLDAGAVGEGLLRVAADRVVADPKAGRVLLDRAGW